MPNLIARRPAPKENDAGHVGDHILVEQLVFGTEQKGINTILAKGEILKGSSASITNLANVAGITGANGGDPYGEGLRLDQFAGCSVQIVNNWAEAGSVAGLDMSATNAVNIASFDLSNLAGSADIGIGERT